MRSIKDKIVLTRASPGTLAVIKGLPFKKYNEPITSPDKKIYKTTKTKPTESSFEIERITT